MRKDMGKVVAERGRVHGDGGRSIAKKGYKKRVAKTPLDEQPKCEPIKTLCGGTKEFTDVLGPLYGFLRKNCGRPWDKVFSEICENISLDSVSQSHVRDHVARDVATNCIVSDGKICTSEGDELSYYPEFYVDPRNGLLCRNKKYRDGWLHGKGKKKSLPYVPGKDKMHQLHLLAGVWYELELTPIPQEWRESRMPTHFPPMLDYTMRLVLDITFSVCEQPSPYRCRERYGDNVYCVKKRQLSKKEIRQLGLWETEIGRKYLESR